PTFFSDCNLLYAVSNDSNPLDGFTEMHRIDVQESSGGLFGSFWDFPRFGWNADEQVFTGNMFAFDFLSGGFTFTNVQVLSIDNSAITDANPNTFAYTRIYGTNSHFTLAPATMHGSQPGDPMWMVEEVNPNVANHNQLNVLSFSNLLGASPTVNQYLVN